MPPKTRRSPGSEARATSTTPIADSHSSARERFEDALRSAGKYVDAKKALCPAHPDGSPSLSIGDRRDSKGIVIKCHAGCDYQDVLSALGMSPRDLFDDDGMRGIYAPKRDYRYPDGRAVHRKPDKTFPQSGNTKGNSLFHVDRIGDAQTVYWPEGEKDVEAIEAAGGVAVCSAMGAGKAYLADVSPLRGKHVIVIADKDEPGRQHAQQVSKILGGVAESVRVVEAAVGKDFADHFAAEKGLDELVPIAEPEQVDGAELLDDIHDFIQRFVVYPSDYNLVAHTLWIVHAWLMDCWDSTPRIAFLSPEPGSGKSRALEVTERLVPRPVHAVNTTSAYLFRKVADPDGKPTILYDEIDTVFGPKAKENEDIRGMLNAGHRKGAVAGRCVVKGKVIETEELDAYCAVMIAGLDDLPDTIMSRSIVIRMKRRAPTEPVEPWRPRINAPEAEKLAARLAQWAASVKEAATDLWPEMPEGVEDRHADRWEALLSIADLAGGHWPETSRVAAVTDVTDSKAATPSVGVLLLRDIKAVFDKHGADRVSTESLLTDLKGIEESPWAVIRRGEPLDSRGLAQRLRKYGVKPDLQRVRDGVARGYTRAQFADAWSRYVVGVAAYESVTSVTTVTDGADNEPDEPVEAVKPGRIPLVDGYGRPPLCPGCGAFFIANGYHRDDCTASREVA
jgi:hypothetical protein